MENEIPMENTAPATKEKPFDLIVVDTRQEILKVIQGSGVPLSVIILILDEMNNALKVQLDQYIKTLG
jgi:hypothetical protein